MKKLRIYIDMDGVLANFEKAKEEHPDFGKKGFRADLELDFSTFAPMPGAIEAVHRLTEMGHELFIATTPPWDHPDAWGQKRHWVEKNLPSLKRKMFLTHRKDLLKGDILIDDTKYRGQPDFEGEWIHFGQVKKVKTLSRWSTKGWKDWDSVMKYIDKKYHTEPENEVVRVFERRLYT